MEPRQALLHTISKHTENRIEKAVEQLSTAPQIKAHLTHMPALKHVLRFGVASGKIPEHNGTNTALQLLQRALHNAEVANQLDKRKNRSGGRLPRLAVELQETLAKTFQQHDQHTPLANDKTFATYLRKMALNFHNLGYTAQELQRNTLLAEAVLDHVTTEYQLMKETGVPPSIIKRSGHQFTVFHADQVYRDARRLFGADKDSKSLVKTAAHRCLTKKYSSIEQAKRAYDQHLKDATRVFGGDPESAPLVRTAAFQLFIKRYRTIEEAKKSYDQHIKDATKIFGGDPETALLVRTAAIQLFTKVYNSIEQAKRAYDQHFKDATKTFGRDEDSKPLVRTAAIKLFIKRYRTIEEAKKAYDQHAKDAKRVFGANPETAPLARTAAIQLFTKQNKNIEEAKRTYDAYLKNAKLIFGAEEDSKPLVRTAANHLFTKKYSSIEQAKRAYDQHYKDATRVFGANPETAPLARTAAVQLFMKKYSTIEEAKHAYDQHLKDATRVFGGDPETALLVRTAANRLFTKQYKSIEEAKQAYDRRVAELREQARKVQLRGLKIPELKELNRNQALAALDPAIERIADNFDASYLGKEDAKQIAQLAALEILETGERNAQAILDEIIVQVTQEAAAYAFSKTTTSLPKER